MLRAVTAGTSRRWILGAPDDLRRASRVRARLVTSRSGSPRSLGVSAFGFSSFGVFVGATFLFGWVAGVLLVVKSWHLLNVSRWVVFSGSGYVTLMLVPVLCGFCCTRVAGRLVSRGWGAAPLRLLALGMCGLVAGLMAI
jgi:hypothetical protein